MIVRATGADDLAAITALYGREVRNGTATFELDAPSTDEMARRIEAVRRLGLPWLTAETGGAFAGYAYLAPFRTRAAYRYTAETSVYVDGTARGKGVGRALMEALIDESRRLGLRHLFGVISDSDTCAASIALHRKLGFEDAGVWRQSGWKFDRWLDVTVLQLDLDPQGSPPYAPGLDLSA